MVMLTVEMNCHQFCMYFSTFLGNVYLQIQSYLMCVPSVVVEIECVSSKAREPLCTSPGESNTFENGGSACRERTDESTLKLLGGFPKTSH